MKPNEIAASSPGSSRTAGSQFDRLIPSGAAMRYAAVIAGNDGIDLPACAYDSSVAEIDAVSGMTEAGNGICPGDLGGVEGAAGLAFAANKHDLSWTPLNGAVNFNVYRGALMAPWSYDHTCFGVELGATSTSDPAAPASHGSLIPNPVPCE